MHCRKLRSSAKLFLIFSAGMGLCLSADAAFASYTVSNGGNTIEIWGTGRNATNTGALGGESPFSNNTATADPTWKLVAFPNAYISDPNDLVFPGTLYSPSAVPGRWVGQAGGTNKVVSSGGKTYRWLSYANYPGSNASTYGTVNNNLSYANSYFRGPGATTLTVGTAGTAVDSAGMIAGLTPSDTTNPDYYSYIAQTTFTPTKTGFYDFSTAIAADNFIEVFLGGTITYANDKAPTIQGGSLLLQLATDNGPGLFSSLLTKTTTGVFLQANTPYNLNYVIRDNYSTTNTANPTDAQFGSTGFIAASTAFTFQQDVPAPLPMLGVAAFIRFSRRLRQRAISTRH